MSRGFNALQRHSQQSGGKILRIGMISSPPCCFFRTSAVLLIPQMPPVSRCLGTSHEWFSPNLPKRRFLACVRPAPVSFVSVMSAPVGFCKTFLNFVCSERERERERGRSNWKVLFYKDCSLGSKSNSKSLLSY